MSETVYDRYVSAYIIYQSLLNWQCFDVNTGVISRILTAMESAIHVLFSSF
jgi:hypothetical protein